ncbi:transient receptor potential cation channel subfamily V member 1-like [Huso huso]|uniref:Transient receptor potential cation channel subfamily V member 1-like n=1 Tax=Huso huso TaxID=61971 RepID=A0ABR0YLE5_HUSHU
MKRCDSADMERSVASETTLTLESEDYLSEDENSQPAKTPKNKPKSLLLGNAFGNKESDSRKAPMDTVCQEETAAVRVRVNTNFDLMTSGDADMSSKDRYPHGRFVMKRLFAVVASGDVSQLDGLYDYLQKNQKHLTDSDFIDRSNGKTCLLKALLNLKNGKNDTIKVLLDIAEKTDDLPKLVNAVYTDCYFKGQSAIHIAIERRSKFYVELLVTKGADVQGKACGKFFQQKKGNGFYFGEYPLSLAACTNQLDIVTFLMVNPYQKADITAQDSIGNMVLHVLVTIADNTPENTSFVTMMYDAILLRAAKLHPKLRLEDIANNEGLTPLKLAAKTGKIGIFRHIIRREIDDKECRHLSRKFTEWAYGPVHSSLYDLNSIDSYEDNSVLEIIAHGCEIPNRHELLQLEPLNKLLQEKWDRFAGFMFYFNFFCYFVYLVIFTTVSYYRLEGKPPFKIEATVTGKLRLTGQLISVAGALYFLFKGIKDFVIKRHTFQSLLLDGYCDILFFLQAVMFLTSSVLYTCGMEEYVALLVLSQALAWINLLYFSRGFQHMGIYSVMIQKMILRDIMRFLFVYMVFLFGFSTALVTLIEDDPPQGQNATEGNKQEDCKRETYNNIYFTTMELFKFTIGMGDLEFTEQYKFKLVFYSLLICYIILTYVLLINMLIALMGETVDKISKESKSIWKLQRAITILNLEKSLPNCLKTKLRSGVIKELGHSAGEDSRRCFRVEEVNWTRWNCNLGIINEDPGQGTVPSIIYPEPTLRTRERSWRRIVPLLRQLSHQQRPPGNQQQQQQEEEMLTIRASSSQSEHRD